jgi:catechol 2,3-dioxygenase-like lactoylglutathione lyase family enzyme
MPSSIDRRTFLVALPALAATPRLFAQASSTIKVRGLSQMTLTVSDLKRSLDFYQGLFGMPVQARQDGMVFLRIGNGPQYLALRQAAAGARPSISHYGMGVEGFNADQIMKTLAEHGVTAADPAATTDAPMKARRVNRAGTTEIFVGDPSGVIFQLQDVSYCGGGGPLGNQCRNVEASPKKGLLVTRDMSHFTVRATDPGTQDFYKQVFGFGVRAMQATTPGYAVGPGVHFLMFIGGAPAAARGAAPGGGGAAAGAAPAGGAAAAGGDAGRGRAGAPGGAPGGRGGTPQPAAIDHACMSIDTFVPDNVIKTLADYGIKPVRRKAAPRVRCSRTSRCACRTAAARKAARPSSTSPIRTSSPSSFRT